MTLIYCLYRSLAKIQVLRFNLRRRQENVCQVEKPCSVLDMEDSGIQQTVQLFIKIWVIPTQQRHILLFKKIWRCGCRSEISLWNGFNTYKLCSWMRTNKPFRANKLIAPPESNTDRKVYYKIKKNFINSNYNQLRICIYIQNSQIIIHFSSMSY